MATWGRCQKALGALQPSERPGEIQAVSALTLSSCLLLAKHCWPLSSEQLNAMLK